MAALAGSRRLVRAPGGAGGAGRPGPRRLLAGLPGSAGAGRQRSRPGDRLHLCGAAAPPAAGRIAGHRRAFLGPDGERVRTEVAVYSDGGADHAVDALRDQAAACSEAVPPRRVEVPSVLALHVRLDRTAAQPGLRELLLLRSGDAVAVLETDGVPPARTIDIARLVAARLG